ncbi:MAG: FAD-binding oxidoreductase [Rhodospirillaceae bacterium]
MAISAVARKSRGKIPDTISTLREFLGDRLSTSPSILERHGSDLSYHKPAPPDAVAFARSLDDVVRVVKTCAANGVPIIPYGTGTSLEGHVMAAEGGISLDVTQMDRVLKVNTEDMDAVVEPGVTRKALNTHIHDTGLFFPIDPGADASLGGMAATRASGTNAVRYGTMRENVLALQVVTANGDVIRTGGRARKSSAGYDLTRLFVGSEGTLGVITEATVRLHGIPEKIAAAVCSFDTLAGAVNTVIATIQSGIPIARIELLDDVQMKCVNAYSKLTYPEKDTLFMEFHGTNAGVQEQAELVQSIATDNGGGNFFWTAQTEDRARLWQARHDVVWSVKSARPGWDLFITDVCVPISHLTDVIVATKADIDREGLLAPIVGHVGDGNFHLAVAVDPKDPSCLPRVEALSDRMVERTLAAGGTCTGEHGVGLGKTKFLAAEHGPGAVEVMHAVKRALDPHNLMNPGKIFAAN